jgi:hypothetical protein
MALVPVFQASKRITGAWSGIDYDYPVGVAAARQSMLGGYSIDTVAFVAQDAPTTGWVPFLRYAQRGFHFYTTNTVGESLNGWTATPAATTAYLQSNATTPHGTGMAQVQRYVSSPGQTGIAHFFTADTTQTPPPAGFTLETSGAQHTGWVTSPTRVEFQVSYNGNGQASGVTVTGGNATGTTVDIGGTNYVMQADDALVAYGAGNWIRYSKADRNDWHIAGIQIVPSDSSTPPSYATFDTIMNNSDTQLTVIDDDSAGAGTDVSYKYTLQVYDVALDRVIDYDPRIINRSPSINN